MVKTEIIKITYYTGWTFFDKSKEKRSIFVNKVVDNPIIELKDPICMSWGNGATLPLCIYRLEVDGTISYYYNDKFNKWNHSIPRWEVINLCETKKN